jgi:hypothetical protein
VWPAPSVDELRRTTDWSTEVAIRDKLRHGAQRYLQPGEQIQAVFLAKRPDVGYNDRSVIATDRRILLFSLDFRSRPKAVLAELRRTTRLGPCTGWLHPLAGFEVPLAVSRRFFTDVEEADRAVGL